LLWRNFLASERFGPLVLLAACAGLCIRLVGRRGAQSWQGMLAVVALIQLAVWAAFTRGMPSRFLVPVVVPVCLLASCVIRGRTAESDGQPGVAHWRRRVLRPVTAGVLIAAVVVNLHTAVGAFAASTRSMVLPPLTGQDLAEAMAFGRPKLPADAKLLLVGEARAFHFRRGTLYATAFDAHPLDEILRTHGPAPTALDELRSLGVTHVWVNWSEIRRLSQTYGYPAALTADGLADVAPGQTNQTVFEHLGLRKLPHPTAKGERTLSPPPHVTIYAVPP